MKLKETNIFTKVCYGILAAGLVVTVSASTAWCVSYKEITKAQEELVSSIKTDLGEYLGEYAVPNESMDGVITPDEDMEQEIVLTDDQIALIVDAVSNSIEYGMIRDMVSQYSTVSEEKLSELELEMHEKISDVLLNHQSTASLTEEEKDALIETISVVVKSDMLSVLAGYSKGNETDFATVSTELQADIEELKNSLDDLRSKHTSLQADVKKKVDSLESEMNADSPDSAISKVTSKVNKLESEMDETNESSKLGVITKSVNDIADSVETLNNAVFGDGVSSGVLGDRFSETETYDVGDFCVKNSMLFVCKTAVTTPGPWDASHWEPTNITNVFEELQKDQLKVQYWDEENKILYLYTP